MNQQLWCWSPWQTLAGCWRGNKIPSQHGLYRLRFCLIAPRSRRAYVQVVYIGQTGDLRERMSMLDGIWKPDPPFKTPHVAAQALWSIRQRARLEQISLVFEVSVAPLPASVSERLRRGYECVAIGLHRQRFGGSPFANHSRLPVGFSASTYNNGPLKSYRGSPSPRRERYHLPSLAPAGPLECDVCSSGWCGHHWSPWANIQDIALPKTTVGLYRLRAAHSTNSLLFVGSGKVRDRLKAYQSGGVVECSWSLKGSWEPGYQEYVDDLIASHVLVTGNIPSL